MNIMFQNLCQMCLFRVHNCVARIWPKTLYTFYKSFIHMAENFLYISLILALISGDIMENSIDF